MSAEVIARAEGAAKTGGELVRRSFREKLLVTHRGLSGPAVLQVVVLLAAGRDGDSSIWRRGARCLLRCARRMRGAMRRQRRLRCVRLLPARMAERWVELATGEHADWTNAGLDRLERGLHEWTVRPEGTEGFAKAEVTAGGVDTRELDARTMESRRVPGLYFIGEVVDVTGWLGGYNFQWAWASAVSAGRVA